MHRSCHICMWAQLTRAEFQQSPSPEFPSQEEHLMVLKSRQFQVQHCFLLLTPELAGALAAVG